MQSTLAFAPTREELDEFYFDVPIIVMDRPAGPPEDQGEAADDLPEALSA